MINVTYENQETGQKMVVTFTPSKKKRNVADVDVKFTPELTNGTSDPGGIMQTVFQSLCGGQV